MPEDIRFVLEAPNANRNQKKRPRLVTSCDNCRMKKIKCIQKTPDSVCEACLTAGVSCRFRDRERYYAERSRIAAAQSASAKASSGPKSGKSSSREPDPAGVPRQHAHPADATALQGGPTRSPVRRSSSYHPYRVAAVAMEPPLRSSPESDASTLSTPPPLGPLFEPDDPMRPHSDIMMSYITAFFDNLNVEFPFLAYDETIRQFFTRTLPPLLMNCIAAHAVRFSDLPEVTKRGVMHVCDLYCDNAKALIIPELANPTIDTLHGLILLAYAEYYRNRMTEFCTYGQMVMPLAVRLGFSDHTISQMAETEYDRNILQTTWHYVQVTNDAVSNVSLF